MGDVERAAVGGRRSCGADDRGRKRRGTVAAVRVAEEGAPRYSIHALA